MFGYIEYILKKLFFKKILKTIIFEGLIKGDFFLRKKVKIYYFCDVNNFGDSLNRELLNYLHLNFINVSPYFAQISCIGSILDNYLERDIKNCKPIHIFGAGFIKPPILDNEHFYRPIKFHILRGELTKNRCEKITGLNLSEVVLGDPGLLISKIFQPNSFEKKYDVGIILHYADKTEDIGRYIDLKKSNIKFIDIQMNPWDFVNEVVSCKFILSSAMHGLICADSFGIPNKHIIVSNKLVGGMYKFLDYYSVFHNFEYKPFLLKHHVITEDDIDLFKQEYNIKISEINEIQNKLIKVFNDELVYNLKFIK